DLGGSWPNAEETANCASVANRGMAVNGGTVNDSVTNWGGPSACGNSTAVINVTVPSSTPSTGTPSSDNWIANDYPMTQTGTGTWTLTITGVPVAALAYKFTLGTWNTTEETSTCGSL